VLQGSFLSSGRALGKQLSVKLWLELEWQTQPAGRIPSSEQLAEFVYDVTLLSVTVDWVWIGNRFYWTR
jgi:hypothetical protein